MRLHSCAVTKLFIPLQQLQRTKYHFMSIIYTSPVMDIDVHNPSHGCITAQPHDYTAAHFGGCTSLHLHSRVILQLCSYVTARLQICVVMQLFNLQQTTSLHNRKHLQPHKYITAKLCGCVVMYICNCIVMRLQNCITKHLHNCRFAQLHGFVYKQPPNYATT